MIVKFFSRGSSGGDSPVNYLLGDDRDRKGASVLRGNAEITKEIVNATDYARRYTSGALSFEESHKNITAEQKNSIMDNFEKTLFSGLKADQYNVLWVQHTDKEDRLELNFLIPNQELRSGKRLQPFFHAADLKRVNAFQNVINMAYQLSDPHDPAKKRTKNPHFSRSASLKGVDKTDYTKEQKKLITHKQAKNDITAHIYELAAHKRLKDRQAIKLEIERAGYTIKRVTKRSIRVSSAAFKKNIRLDDPIFSDEFEPHKYLEIAQEMQKEEYERNKKLILQESLETLKEGIKIKAKYHRERFQADNLPEPYELNLSAQEQKQHLLDEQPKPTDNSSLDMGF